MLFHQRMANLLQDLDGLLLLDGAEPFRERWEELKDELTRAPTPARVIVDNHHIRKLTEAVTTLIEKQTKPTVIATALTYAAALRAGLPA